MTQMPREFRKAAWEQLVYETVKENPGITVQQIMEKLGWTYYRANRKLHTLLMRGKLTYTKTAWLPRMWRVVE